MTNILAWRDLSVKQIHEFYAMDTPESAIKYLALLLGMDRDSEKDAIILDLYYYTLRFAKDKSFSAEQASTLFSIVKTTHESCTSTPFMNMDKDFANLKTLLVNHSVQRPPFSQKIFSLAEMKAITEYVTNTYFRHYLLYKYAFSKKMRLDFSVEDPSNVVEKDMDGVPSQDGETKASTDGATSTQMVPAAAETNIPDPKLSLISTAEVPQKVPEVPPLPETAKDKAAAELNKIIQATVGPKIDEMLKTITQKMAQHDEQIMKQLKKLDDAEGGPIKKKGLS